MFPPLPPEGATSGPRSDTTGKAAIAAPVDMLASLEDLLSLGAAALSAEVCLLGLASPRDRWIRTVVGVPPEEIRHRTAFCTFAMMQPDVLWVRDVREIRTLSRLPGAPQDLRSFVAGPIVDAAGAKLGGLAVFFPGPREPSPGALAHLATLRRHIALHVAQKRRSEQLLGERQQELGALAMLRGLLRASTTLAVIGTDLGGRITVFSEGAQRMFLVPAREALGRTASFLFAPPGPGPRDTSLFFTAVEGVGADAPVERAFALRRADGAVFQGSIAAALIQDEASVPKGYALIARDVTEQRAAEQMKDDFVSMVSHELRTPLTAIRGGLGLLIGEVAGPLSEPVRELVDIAHANSERLLRVVGDILDTQAIAAGRLTLTYAEMDALEAVDRAMRVVLPLSGPRGVTVGLRQVAPRATLEADMGRVVQVLVNLLSNAVKHSPVGGRVHMDVEVDAERLRISVEDEGAGVPEEDRELLFQKFSRLSREPGGTGLGLAIVKAVVRLHGGDVSYRPASPSGAIFSFSLPLTRQGARRPQGPSR